MPGAELVEVTGEDAWKAKLHVKLGPIALQFLADVVREEVDEAAGRVVLAVKAREAKGRGSAEAKIESRLSAGGDGTQTRVDIATDLALRGAVAQYGRSVVADVATRLTSQFAQCIAAKLADEPSAPCLCTRADRRSASAVRLPLAFPVPPIEEVVVDDGRILAVIEAKREAALATHRFVHEHPELSHEERDCSRYLCDVLEGAGLEVERGVAGMETAFRATLRGSRPGRSVGLVALYDAVPVFRPDGTIEPVHSCGHDAIPAGVIATALAFADLREELSGSLVVFGCPADEIPAPLTVEIGGGKAVSAAAGLWDSVDAALYAHPEFEDTVFLHSRWMRRDRAMVTGTRSLTHEPESPIEAVLTAIAAVKSLPPGDAIVEHIALDGDVEEGGGLVVRIHFLLRADEEAGLDELAAPLRAALPEAVWSSDPVVCGLRPDVEVTQAVKAAVLALGGEFVDDPAQLPFGTDFGNVSQRVPSALIGIGRPGGWAFHTDEGAEQFAQDGEECAMSIARVLALAAVRLLERP